MNNINTIEQNVDLWIHNIAYDAGGFVPNFAQQQAAIAAHNTATGDTTFLHGYEGGFQWGVTSSNGSSPQANNLLTLSRDIPNDPLFRHAEKDTYGIFQQSGFRNINLYSFSIYFAGTNNWGIYHWPFQNPGKGDGSDGQANNRLYRATAGYAGPLDYTKTSTVNQDAASVSVRGQALAEWMQATQAVLPSTATQCVIFLGL